MEVRNIRVEIGVHGGMGRLTVLGRRRGRARHRRGPDLRPLLPVPTEVARPDSVGLGLAVARQLARLMAGDLVYGRQDGWTRFELSLPVEAVSPADPSLESELSLLDGRTASETLTWPT